MKMKNESGRSMVEMLGVLAIIGVLSIGGIAGYTMAMNRYRANEIVDTAAKLSVIAMTANGGVGQKTEWSTTSHGPLPGCATKIESDRYGVVAITYDSKCTNIENVVNGIIGGKKATSAADSVTGTTYIDFSKSSVTSAS